MQNICLGKTITGDEEILREYNNRFYLTQHKCGKGAFKVVYLGIDTENETGEFVIISIINILAIKPAVERKRIINERNLLKYINHPNVIRFIHDEYNSQRKEVIFVTEHLLNGDLNQKMQIVKNSEIGRFSNEAIVKIIIQTLRGLVHIHSLGIIHRDIKIDNIGIDSNNSVKVFDFGLSTELVSPEQLNELGGRPRGVFSINQLKGQVSRYLGSVGFSEDQIKKVLRILFKFNDTWTINHVEEMIRTPQNFVENLYQRTGLEIEIPQYTPVLPTESGCYRCGIMGTPEYVAPEISTENYDKSVDIYAFGLAIFELISMKRIIGFSIAGLAGPNGIYNTLLDIYQSEQNAENLSRLLKVEYKKFFNYPDDQKLSDSELLDEHDVSIIGNIYNQYDDLGNMLSEIVESCLMYPQNRPSAQDLLNRYEERLLALHPDALDSAIE